MRYLSHGLEVKPQQTKQSNIMSKKAKKVAKVVAPATPELLQQNIPSKAALQAHNALLDEKQASAKLEKQHSAHLKKYGQDIIDATAVAGEKYLTICSYIRENMVAPKLVSFELAAIGMHRAVISKINRVANLPNDQWNQFAARIIGFNKVIELNSAQSAEALARASGESLTDVKAIISEMEEEEEKQGKPLIAPTPEEQKEKAEKAFVTAAARALSAASVLAIKRERKVNGGNGYILTITKDKKWVAPSGVPKPAEPQKNGRISSRNC